MTKNCSFDIYFEKFNKNIHVKFSRGLNIIYGESGTGKSKIIYSILNKANLDSANFSISNKVIPESIQLIFQNPENQIICQNLQSELSFGLESNSDDGVDLKDELQRIKYFLPFIDDWLRHPSTLSGGEMEILNIITAFTSKSDLVLIDDGLSYLNPSTKKQWIDWIINNYSKNKIILWFTSDLNDLSYGKAKWILSLSDLQPHDISDSTPDYKHRHRNGSLSIQAKDLTFGFEASTKAIIDKLNINLSNARSVGIIGENGSGKTTLSQLISNSIKPLSGSIELNILNSIPAIGVLNQFPERMLGSNTLEDLLLKLISNNKFDQNLLNSFIKKLKSYQINWNTIKDQNAKDLSWSIVRITLIIILSQSNYDLIILDEPTFGLGYQQKRKLSELLKNILVNKHLILISHDIDFVNAHCDQVVNFDLKNVYHNHRILKNAK
tara:strand:+ start:962 stop:2278 length:1317 start_codon:yes stop_codon:yes gene_type:complete